MVLGTGCEEQREEKRDRRKTCRETAQFALCSCTLLCSYFTLAGRSVKFLIILREFDLSVNLLQRWRSTTCRRYRNSAGSGGGSMKENWGMEGILLQWTFSIARSTGMSWNQKGEKKNHFIFFFFSFLIMKEKNERNHFSCDKLAVARDNGLQDIPVKSFQWDFACMDTDWIFRFCPAIWLLILPLCSRNSALRWHWLPAIVYWAREKENLHTNRTRAYDSCTSVCVSVCVSR